MSLKLKGGEGDETVCETDDLSVLYHGNVAENPGWVTGIE